METSSVDIDKLLSKNFFLWLQCPKISLLLFKDGAVLTMESLVVDSRLCGKKITGSSPLFYQASDVSVGLSLDMGVKKR